MTADKTEQAASDSNQKEAATPIWKDGILSFGGIAVKKFARHPALNQRKLLDAFQAAGWPAVIKNPFHDVNNRSVPRTLNETVYDLNSSIKHSILRFHADGNGGCRWLVVSSVNSP